MKGGVSQGNKIGPILFFILPLAISQGNCQEEDITLFMDDSTISEVIDMSQHISNCSIGSSQQEPEYGTQC